MSNRHRTGEQNSNWRGGRLIASNGYVLIRVGVGYPGADVRGYIYEHTLVAQKKLGRSLIKGEMVHHIDHNPLNNSSDNLEITTHREHRFKHRKPESKLQLLDEPNILIQCECGCGDSFMKFDAWRRPRRFVSGHNRSTVK